MTLFRLAWTLCVTGVVACVMSGGQRVVHAAAPDSIIARLVALPLSDRASLLVELKQPVPLARETKSDAQSVVVEAGPIDGNVEALELTPAGTTPLIGPVAVSAVTTASGQVFLRITVQLRARASHRVRLSGSRLYVDFAPLPVRGAPATVEATSRPVHAPGSAVAGTSTSPPGATGPGPTAAQTPATAQNAAAAPHAAAALSEEDTDAAYRALQADVTRRAGQLANRADVKGILALIDDAKRKDELLGRRRPGVIEPLLEAVNRKLDDARALRLQLDAAAFEKQGATRTDTPR